MSSILLIDDSATVREILRLARESGEHRVLEAADGREGVRLYREKRPASLCQSGIAALESPLCFEAIAGVE